MPSLYLYSGENKPDGSSGRALAVKSTSSLSGRRRCYKRRYYPYGSALTHVIGYVSKNHDKDVERLDREKQTGELRRHHDIGKLGIERYYEDISCMGKPVMKRLKSTNRGRVTASLKMPPYRTRYLPDADPPSSILKRCW
ncbi:hypothetical protein KCP71_24175 [Salmonella enterica subsp. enterica]|nr:hypothetical protein KCP71_24175 [Salmonella enterica subsp. enterica]